MLLEPRGRSALSDERDIEVITRRGALSLVGLAGVLGLATPAVLLAVSDAAAQADKPLPGEGGVARTAPQPEKPIPPASGPTWQQPRRTRPRQTRQYRLPRRRRQQTNPEDKST